MQAFARSCPRSARRVLAIPTLRSKAFASLPSLPSDASDALDEMTPRTASILEGLRSPVPAASRRSLSKAVTLVESSCPKRRAQAALLLQAVADDAMNGFTPESAFRVGIAGPPGAGKSTFIETLGLHVLESTPSSLPWSPPNLSVLSIDPSSSYSGGSILGDKTRMPTLSNHRRAFVRPSPSGSNLGGVAAYTSDVVQLCSSAGYGCCLVETVGVGQSEVEVDKCVDMMLLLVPPAGGDDLQGSKKGIVEVRGVRARSECEAP